MLGTSGATLVVVVVLYYSSGGRSSSSIVVVVVVVVVVHSRSLSGTNGDRCQCALTMARLTEAELEMAVGLSTALAGTAHCSKRFEELAESESSERDIVIMRGLPRVSTQDIAGNEDIIAEIIEFNKDATIAKPFFMEHVWRILDKSLMGRLSKQELVTLQKSCYRWEADKTRLVYSYFLRQVTRSEFSCSLPVFKLKQRWLFKRQEVDKTPTLLSVSACTGISALPDYPGPTCEGMDALEDFHEDIPICVKSDTTTAEATLPAAPVVDLCSDTEEAPASKAASLRKRPSPPQDIETTMSCLESRPATNVRQHMKAVRAHAATMKRPASAPEKKTKTKTKKKKTTCVAKASAAPLDIDHGDFHKHTLLACIGACSDPMSSEDRKATIRAGVQRNTYLAQVRDSTLKKAVVQITNRQVGSKENVDAAIRVLLELYTMGASSADLQRCKVAGCFFGVAIGRM